MAALWLSISRLKSLFCCCKKNTAWAHATRCSCKTNTFPPCSVLVLCFTTVHALLWVEEYHSPALFMHPLIPFCLFYPSHSSHPDQLFYTIHLFCIIQLFDPTHPRSAIFTLFIHFTLFSCLTLFIHFTLFSCLTLFIHSSCSAVLPCSPILPY